MGDTTGVLTLETLPVEVQVAVLEFVGLRGLARMSRTCRYWRDLCNDTELWRRLLALMPEVEECEETPDMHPRVRCLLRMKRVFGRELESFPLNFRNPDNENHQSWLREGTHAVLHTTTEEFVRTAACIAAHQINARGKSPLGIVFVTGEGPLVTPLLESALVDAGIMVPVRCEDQVFSGFPSRANIYILAPDRVFFVSDDFFRLDDRSLIICGLLPSMFPSPEATAHRAFGSVRKCVFYAWPSYRKALLPRWSALDCLDELRLISRTSPSEHLEAVWRGFNFWLEQTWVPAERDRPSTILCMATFMMFPHYVPLLIQPPPIRADVMPHGADVDAEPRWVMGEEVD